MIEPDWSPVALACGHVIEGMGHFECPAVGSDEPSRAECPEGCGWQEFVLEPGVQDCTCHPARHTCGRVAVEIDLGFVGEGETIEINLNESAP